MMTMSARSHTVSLAILPVVVAGLLACGLVGCGDTKPPKPNPGSGKSASGGQSVTQQQGPDPIPSDGAACPIHFSSPGPSTGIDFVHTSGDSEIKPFPAANGSGVGAFDYDLDGFCDLYFATGNTISEKSLATTASNRLYRNLGDLKFSERTVETAVGHTGFSAGVAIGDYNNDGFPDLYVVCFGPNRLYLNLGDGTFLDASDDSGLNDPRWGTSAVFVDYDADGLLDVYTGNYGKWSAETNQFCGNRETGLRMFCSPTTVPPEHDGLHRNMGNGTFADVAESTGISKLLSRTQGVLAADLNGDSYTDLYLGNDLNPNAVLINDKGQGFGDQAEVIGAAYDRAGVAQAGMGVTVADVDRDGLFDLFVTNFENEHNAFYRQDQGGFYQDTSHLRGLAAGGMPFIGWGTMFADFDLDRWHDVIVINGHTDNNLHELGREGDYQQPPLVWHNRNGRFEPVGECAGDYFRSIHTGRGLAIADLDNDVDWDVICCHQDSGPDLLVNDSQRSSASSNVIQLRLIGRMANRDAIGTVVTIGDGESTSIEQLAGGGSYLSSSQHVVCAVLGETADSPTPLKIVWPGGRVTNTTVVKGGRYVITEPPSNDDAAPLLELVD